MKKLLYLYVMIDKGKKMDTDFYNFVQGQLGYDTQRDLGNLPEHDIEFQNETGIGPVYNNGRPQTRDEMRENLQEDNRMTDDEIEDYLDSFDA